MDFTAIKSKWWYRLIKVIVVAVGLVAVITIAFAWKFSMESAVIIKDAPRLDPRTIFNRDWQDSMGKVLIFIIITWLVISLAVKSIYYIITGKK